MIYMYHLHSLLITEINADIGRRSETIKRWNIDVPEKAQAEEESTWQLASTTLPSGMSNATEKGQSGKFNGNQWTKKKEDEDEVKKKEAEKGIQQSAPPAAAANNAASTCPQIEAVGNNQLASSEMIAGKPRPYNKTSTYWETDQVLGLNAAAAASVAVGNNQVASLDINEELSTPKDEYYKKGLSWAKKKESRMAEIRDGPLKKCGKCGIEKKKWSYINAEWNKLEDGERVCQVCIKAEIKSNPVAAAAAAAASKKRDNISRSPQIKSGVQRELQVHSYSKEKSNWVNDGLKYLAQYAAQADEHQNGSAAASQSIINNDIVSPSPQPVEKSMMKEKRSEDEEKVEDNNPADEIVYLGEAQIEGCGTADVNGTYFLQGSMYIKQENHHPSGSSEAKDSYAIHYQTHTVRGSFEQVGYWFISMWKGDITTSDPLVHMYRSRMNVDSRVPPKDGWEALYGNDPPPLCQMKGKDETEDKLMTDAGGKTEETSDEQGSLLESGNGTHITPVGSGGSSTGSSGIAMLAKAAQSDLLHSLFQPNTKVAKNDSNDNMDEGTIATTAQLDVTQTRSGRKITPSSKKKEAATTKYIPIKKPAPGRVSLEDAAISGCDKCNKELETGVRRNNESHSNQCPRKMWGRSEKPPQKRKHTASKKPPQKRRKQSEMKPSGKGIKVPTATDILKGRGRLTNDHEGNKKLRDEARKLRGDYQDGGWGKSEKKYQYSLELVKRVRSYGGRFLEKRGDDNLWYEMSEEDTRKKAAQGEITSCVLLISLSSCLLLFGLYRLSYLVLREKRWE